MDIHHDSRGARVRGTRRVAVALAAAFLLAGCTTGDSDDDAPEGGAGGDDAHIALLMPDTVLSRWEQQDRPTFIARVEAECPGCTVTTYNADAESAVQQNQAEAAITAGAQVIVITAVDTSVATGIVDLAVESDVRVISYGRIIPHQDVDYGVTTDPAVIGEQQAESLLAELEERGITSGGIVAHHGSPTDSAAPQYKEGALSVLEASDFDIVAEYDTPGWDPMEAQRQMEQAISAVGSEGFVGVYAGNDGIASGVIAAMRGAGIDPSTIPVTGQDAEVSALQRIVAGEQFNTIYQPITDFAARAADLAIALAHGEDPPEGLINGTTPTEAGDIDAYLYDNVVITLDNIEDTVIGDGFVTVEEICTGEYVRACEEAGLIE